MADSSLITMEPLIRVESVKYVWISIYNNLKWCSQISSCVKHHGKLSFDIKRLPRFQVKQNASAVLVHYFIIFLSSDS